MARRHGSFVAFSIKNVNKLQFTDTQWEQIQNNGSYCPFLFNSKTITTDGKLMPCCVINHNGIEYTDPNAFNTDRIKQLRKNSLSGIKDPQCKKCWVNESIGARSYRQGAIESAIEWKSNIRNNINEDYSITDPIIELLDVKFDNICNLRCRYCSIIFSSSWYNETELLTNEVPEFKLIKRKDIPNKIITSVDDLEIIKNDLNTAKKIYFNGGEPLFNDKHYSILDYFLKINKTDVHLFYNTNFSNITKVLPYWKRFSNIEVGASLDANYNRGEYIRKNLDWNQVIANRELMIKETPHVKFIINPTVSVFNAYNIVDFHKEWTEKKLIDPFDFMPWSYVTFPQHYDIKNLPDHHKITITKIYENHINWLNSVHTDKSEDGKKFTIQAFNGIINRLKLPRVGAHDIVWKVDKWLDNHRNESFFETFPEYSDFKDTFDKY